jgi:prevent-host-death family protein
MRIGVRDLKNHATEIVRQVREERAEFVVTYYGRPVAVLLPIDQGWLEEETARVTEATRPGEATEAELQALAAKRKGRARRGRDEFVWQ